MTGLLQLEYYLPASSNIFISQKVSRGMNDSSAGERAIALVAACISRGQNTKYNWLAKAGWMCGRPDFMCQTRETRQKLLVSALGTLPRVNAPTISRQERLLGRSDSQWTRWWRNVGLHNERVCIQFPMYEILQLAIVQILRVQLAQGPPKQSHMCLVTARQLCNNLSRDPQSVNCPGSGQPSVIASTCT